MLSEAECRLAAYAYAIRTGEQDKMLWFAPAAEVFVEAVRLHERADRTSPQPHALRVRSAVPRAP